MPALIHHVSMQQPAGVEAHFAAFVATAALQHPSWKHSWLNPARTLHPFFQDLLPLLENTVHAKYHRGLKLPARPGWIRTAHLKRSLARARPDVMLIWNRTAKLGGLFEAFAPERCIHWEHGAVWHKGKERERAAYLRRIPNAIANSRAAARVLELMWGYKGSVRVCRNALRPSLMPNEPLAPSYPSDRPINLGVAARLFPVKGVPLVLHACKLLRDDGFDAFVHVAGTGPDAEALQALASRLGISAAVHFHGAVREMRTFYSTIDCLVHVPLTEAFGLVAIEAAAHGVPVIAAHVDGLPEAVTEGVTGYCVMPHLPLDDYADLGGRIDGIPEVVYDPAADALTTPKLLDPGTLAAAIARLFSDSVDYQRLGRSASEHILTEYRFDAHVDDVMRVVETVRASAGSR